LLGRLRRGGINGFLFSYSCSWLRSFSFMANI
jgi:hypothetical protein